MRQDPFCWTCGVINGHSDGCAPDQPDEKPKKPRCSTCGWRGRHAGGCGEVELDDTDRVESTTEPYTEEEIARIREEIPKLIQPERSVLRWIATYDAQAREIAQRKEWMADERRISDACRSDASRIGEQFAATLHRIDETTAALAECDEMILDLFTQGCLTLNGKLYSHDFISAYENAQAYLVRKGIIKPEECVYV